MLEEEKKSHCWLKAIGIMLMTLLGAFLAFYFIVDTTIDRMIDPNYQIKRMEKMMRHQTKDFRRLEHKFIDKSFEGRMSPTLVNLVKESNEYKIIVDLKPLDNDEKNLKVDLSNNIITINGQIDKKVRRGEEIINFSQGFYLDEELLPDKMTKEKKGDKYIITIPFKD